MDPQGIALMTGVESVATLAAAAAAESAWYMSCRSLGENSIGLFWPEKWPQ